MNRKEAGMTAHHAPRPRLRPGADHHPLSRTRREPAPGPEALRAAFLRAAPADPDQAARAARLARRLGASPALADHGLDEAEAWAAGPDFEDLCRRAPVLSAMALTPGFLDLARDDLDRLAALEETMARPSLLARAMEAAASCTLRQRSPEALADVVRELNRRYRAFPEVLALAPAGAGLPNPASTSGAPDRDALHAILARALDQDPGRAARLAALAAPLAAPLDRLLSANWAEVRDANGQSLSPEAVASLAAPLPDPGRLPDRDIREALAPLPGLAPHPALLREADAPGEKGPDAAGERREWTQAREQAGRADDRERKLLRRADPDRPAPELLAQARAEAKDGPDRALWRAIETRGGLGRAGLLRILDPESVRALEDKGLASASGRASLPALARRLRLPLDRAARLLLERPGPGEHDQARAAELARERAGGLAWRVPATSERLRFLALEARVLAGLAGLAGSSPLATAGNDGEAPPQADPRQTAEQEQAPSGRPRWSAIPGIRTLATPGAGFRAASDGLERELRTRPVPELGQDRPALEAAVVRLGLQARQAFLAGNPALALDRRARQILALETLARERAAFLAARRLLRLARLGQRSAKARGPAREQGAALLAAHGLHPRPERLRAPERSLAEFRDQEQGPAGLTLVDLPRAVTGDRPPCRLSDLTLAGLSRAARACRHLDHLARTAEASLAPKAPGDLAERGRAALQAARALPRRAPASGPEAWRDALAARGHLHLLPPRPAGDVAKAAATDAGGLSEALFGPLLAGLDQEAQGNREALTRLKDLFAALRSGTGQGKSDHPEEEGAVVPGGTAGEWRAEDRAPGGPAFWTRLFPRAGAELVPNASELALAALYAGNPGGREGLRAVLGPDAALLLGRLLDGLPGPLRAFVRGVRSLMADLLPPAQQARRRLTGCLPPGDPAWGLEPVSLDPTGPGQGGRHSGRPDAERPAAGGWNLARTDRDPGWFPVLSQVPGREAFAVLLEPETGPGQPLPRLDPGAVVQAALALVRAACLAPAARDADRLLRDPELARTLAERLGPGRALALAALPRVACWAGPRVMDLARRTLAPLESRSDRMALVRGLARILGRVDASGTRRALGPEGPLALCRAWRSALLDPDAVLALARRLDPGFAPELARELARKQARNPRAPGQSLSAGLAREAAFRTRLAAWLAGILVGLERGADSDAALDLARRAARGARGPEPEFRQSTGQSSAQSTEAKPGPAPGDKPLELALRRLAAAHLLAPDDPRGDARSGLGRGTDLGPDHGPNHGPDHGPGSPDLALLLAPGLLEVLVLPRGRAPGLDMALELLAARAPGAEELCLAACAGPGLWRACLESGAGFSRSPLSPDPGPAHAPESWATAPSPQSPSTPNPQGERP
jgi:hypothetical protein